MAKKRARKKVVKLHPNNVKRKKSPIPAHVTDEGMIAAIHASRAKRVRGKQLAKQSFKGYVKFSGSKLEAKLVESFPELTTDQMIDLLLKYDRVMWYVKQDADGALWVKTFTKKQVANRLGVKLSQEVLNTPASVLLGEGNLGDKLNHHV